MLQGALNPHFASALSNAQSQQTINGLAKGAHAPSILQIPTIPPAFVATAPIRQNGQEVNGMGSMSMQNPQIVGLPGKLLLRLKILHFFRWNQYSTSSATFYAATSGTDSS
jgi:hypothetical protein